MSKNNTSISIVVVPDGIRADEKGNVTAEPSFVYQSVLDSVINFVKSRHSMATVYLAPANNFGGELTEQEIAQKYLKKHGIQNVNCFVAETNNYIDTLGNATLLKNYLLDNKIPFPLKDCHLFVAHIHARRAIFNFERIGFIFKDIHLINYDEYEKTPIVRRLFYYRYSFLHRLYETIALLRDIIRLWNVKG